MIAGVAGCLAGFSLALTVLEYTNRSVKQHAPDAHHKRALKTQFRSQHGLLVFLVGREPCNFDFFPYVKINQSATNINRTLPYGIRPIGDF